MWFFWLFALVPVLFGVVCLFFDRRITWQEVLGSAGVGLLMAGLFQLIACAGMTRDIETWSGLITQTTRFGAWVEQYQEAHTETYACGTDSKGNTTYCTRVYYTTEYAHHGGNWDIDRNFGTINDDVGVNDGFHQIVKQAFGGNINAVYEQSCTHGGHYYSGDRKAYVTHNTTGYIFPVTMTKSFQNKIKAAPSLFSYPKVPTNITTYAWPINNDWNNSDRVMGTAKSMIDTRNWDILNTILGPAKKVNLIVIGFPAGHSMESAKWQEATFIGGKKNDLIICYAGGSKETPAEWAYVFGWTEKTIVKVNLQDIFTQNPINNSIIDKVSAEVNANYVKKDWHKFDYIRIEPPTWSYWVYLVVIFLVQGGLYVWFNLNEFNNTWFDETGVNKAFLDRIKGPGVFFVNLIKAFFIRPKVQPIQMQPVQTPVVQPNWSDSSFRNPARRQPRRYSNKRRA